MQILAFIGFFIIFFFFALGVGFLIFLGEDEDDDEFSRLNK